MKAYTTIQDFIDALSQLDTSQPLNSIGQGMKRVRHIISFAMAGVIVTIRKQR